MENKIPRVAINGTGRIGGQFVRVLIEEGCLGKLCNVVAIVDINYSAQDIVNQLTCDSVHGRLNRTHPDVIITTQPTSRPDLTKLYSVVINGQETLCLQGVSNLLDLPWGELEIDYVIEATGRYTNKIAEGHLIAGAKRVIITGPVKDDDIKMIVMGVNDHEYDSNIHRIVSNASCTTNAAAPELDILQQNGMKITYIFLLTVHAYTQTQNLLDGRSQKDPSAVWSAPLNMLIGPTGAKDALIKIFPNLKGKIESAKALRVGHPDVSYLYMVIGFENETTKSNVDAMFKTASENNKRIFGYTDKPFGSTNYIHDSRSCIYIGGENRSDPRNVITLESWYDNEWGYSCRIRDLLEMMIKKSK
jgi:glyceraldehyde 3-phosphate dehydrogenase